MPLSPGDRVQVHQAHGPVHECEVVAGPDHRGLVLVRHWGTDPGALNCCWLVPSALVRPHPSDPPRRPTQ